MTKPDEEPKYKKGMYLALKDESIGFMVIKLRMHCGVLMEDMWSCDRVAGIRPNHINNQLTTYIGDYTIPSCELDLYFRPLTKTEEILYVHNNSSSN